jgi:hypothetical protein
MRHAAGHAAAEHAVVPAAQVSAAQVRDGMVHPPLPRVQGATEPGDCPVFITT